MAIRPLLKSNGGRLRKVDEELKQFLESKRSKIKVIGCGGAGNNTITRMNYEGIEGAETIVVNTDAQDLLYSQADKKVLIGKDLTKGLGAGGDPNIGMESAKESREDLKQAIEKADMVFVTCGLGGGTGTGSAPIVAGIAKQLGILTVGVVTLPFNMEGKQRMNNALNGLAKMRQSVDTLLIIPNDKMLEVVPDISINTAFKMVDDILVNSVKGIIELITKAGLVNLDFADVKTVMGNGGVAMIGVGESNVNGRAMESVMKALSDPFLAIDIEGAKGALINVSGGSNMSLNEAREIVEVVSSKLSEDAQIIWGARVEDGLKDTIKTMVVVTGVKEKEFYKEIFTNGITDKKMLEKVLDIDFVKN